MTTTIPTPTGHVADRAVEPLVDLSRLASGIRWRRRIWVALALLGVIVGAAIGAVTPLRGTAAVQVYVVHADESAGTIDSLMKTDLALLQTTTVAEEAARRLGVTDPPARFVSTYTGFVIAGHILEIVVHGTDSADAVVRARAVADAFIAVHVKQASDATAAQVAAYDGLRDKARQDLDAVEAQLKAPGTDPARRLVLADQQTKLESAIAALEQQAQQVAIGSPAVAAGTKIINEAHATSHSFLVTAAAYGGIGLLLGLGLGLVLAAVAAVARDRPVLRRDIAAHLGASVVAQLPVLPRGPLAARRGRKAESEWERASGVLARLIRSDRGQVSLLELACPTQAAMLATRLAGELAGERPLVLVDDLPGQDLVRAADGLPDGVSTVPGSGFPDDAVDADAQLLTIGSVGQGTPWTDLRRLGAETLLMVRAGRTEAPWMHTVARQLADAGIAIVGIVVVNPDPRDRTDGTLWDALHTAVRGRLAARPVPVVEEPAAATGLPDHIPAEAWSSGREHPAFLATANGTAHGQANGTANGHTNSAGRATSIAVLDAPPDVAAEPGGLSHTGSDGSAGDAPAATTQGSTADLSDGPADRATDGAGAPQPAPDPTGEPATSAERPAPTPRPRPRPHPRPRPAVGEGDQPVAEPSPVVRDTPADTVESS